MLRLLVHPKIKKKAISSKILKYFRFPLTACDILSSDNSSTIDFFFPNGTLYTEENIEEEV